jgi:hypothetical protein
VALTCSRQPKAKIGGLVINGVHTNATSCKAGVRASNSYTGQLKMRVFALLCLVKTQDGYPIIKEEGVCFTLPSQDSRQVPNN